MRVAAHRRPAQRSVRLDRSLEALPLFRLSDSSDGAAITFSPPEGGRWRVFPSPGERLPGTFDQDVYIEICHRYDSAGVPHGESIRFTLHAFLRSIGRRADGRNYALLRSALTRLERTVLESRGAYYDAAAGRHVDARFALLTGVAIARRRASDREQLALFPSVATAEPGEATVTLAPMLRANIAAGHTATLSLARYHALSSPVARRLYRLLEVARAEGCLAWRVPLERLAEWLPLAQRYPSHLQRVLQPAHEMLLGAGLVRDLSLRQEHRDWYVDYVLATRAT